MNLPAIEAIATFIVSLIIIVRITLGPQNLRNGNRRYDQRGGYGMQGVPPGYPMRPVARSSGFFWLLVLTVIAYFLLKQYAPSVLYPLHSFVPWL